MTPRPWDSRNAETSTTFVAYWAPVTCLVRWPLLVRADLFIVASSDDVLSGLGVPGEPPIRVSPTVS
jgi:hypothetical protein